MSIQFENGHFSDERWIEAGPAAFAVYVYACDYSDHRNLDGVVPRAMLERIVLPVSHDVMQDSIQTLIDLGFFTSASRGNSIKIVGFLEQKIGLLAADKEETRQGYRDSQRRYRKHKAGNHELCNPAKCPGARELSGGNVIQDKTPDTAKDTMGVSGQVMTPEFPTTVRNVTSRDVTVRSTGTSKTRNVKAGSGSGTPPEPSGSAGAPPAGPEYLRESLVFEGTSVQLATLLAEDLDAGLPQLRVETADGDADAMLVTLPGDDLEGPAESAAAAAVRAANRRAAEAMRGFGSVQADAAGNAWLVCQADYETQQEYARAFEFAVDLGLTDWSPADAEAGA